MKKTTLGIQSLQGSTDESSGGLVYRVQSIKEVLIDCVDIDQKLRAILSGEGDEQSKTGVPITESIDGLTYDILTMVCNLRVNLDRTVSHLTGSKAQYGGQQAQEKRVGHG